MNAERAEDRSKAWEQQLGLNKGGEGYRTFRWPLSLPDSAVDRAKVICKHCNVELSYHRSTKII